MGEKMEMDQSSEGASATAGCAWVSRPRTSAERRSPEWVARSGDRPQLSGVPLAFRTLSFVIRVSPFAVRMIHSVEPHRAPCSLSLGERCVLSRSERRLCNPLAPARGLRRRTSCASDPSKLHGPFRTGWAHGPCATPNRTTNVKLYHQFAKRSLSIPGLFFTRPDILVCQTFGGQQCLPHESREIRGRFAPASA